MGKILFCLLLSLVMACTAMGQSIPSDEQRFIDVIDSARTKYKAAPNEMLKGVERVNRRKAICNTLNSRNVSNWVGKITKLDSTGKDAMGVLAISIAKDIRLKTWNNEFSDKQFGTLIGGESGLFRAVSSMKVGDTVRFSGNFFNSEKDCVHESSITDSGSMDDPEFIFRFYQVELLKP